MFEWIKIFIQQTYGINDTGTTKRFKLNDRNGKIIKTQIKTKKSHSTIVKIPLLVACSLP